MKAQKDKIRETRRLDKEYAISLIKQLAVDSLKDYVEPQRAGTPKGETIGFSSEKIRANYFMLLYPNCLRLREIADLAKVKPNVLRAWKIQEDFLKEWEKFCESLAELIINTIEIEVMKKYIPLVPDLRKSLKGKRILKVDLKSIYKNPEEGSVDMFLGDALPFFTSRVGVTVMEWLISHKTGDCGTLEYLSLAERIMRNIHVRNKKGLKRWAKSPDNLKITKLMIDRDIDILVDPETLKQPREKTEDFVKHLKKFISDSIDVLAS